jgi:hypothetical protein
MRRTRTPSELKEINARRTPAMKRAVLSAVATFPLWRTVLVTVSSAKSGAELLLVEIGSMWTIVSRKGFVI